LTKIGIFDRQKLEENFELHKSSNITDLHVHSHVHTVLPVYFSLAVCTL